MKKCTKCENEKEESEFGKNKNTKDGLNYRCKFCEKKRITEYRLNNADEIKKRSEKWGSKSIEKQKQYQKKYVRDHPQMAASIRMRKYRESPEFLKKEKEQRKAYYVQNIEEQRKKRKEYYHKNKLIERQKSNDYKKNRFKNDPIFRIKKNIRDRMRNYLNGKHIGKRTFDIIGLNHDEFKQYIESKFVIGMSWENYGIWHIDHIKPMCLAKTEDDVLIFNHFTNLQPLWGIDNLRKNRKYDN